MLLDRNTAIPIMTKPYPNSEQPNPGFLIRRLVPLSTLTRLVIASHLLAGCRAEEPGAEPETSTSVQAIATSGASYTFPTGSLIIPMDTTFQGSGGIFMAYGLVYKLLQSNIPVSWVIKPGKRLSTISDAPTGATEVGTTATFTTKAPHNLGVGDVVIIENVGVAGYNGSWTVTSIVSTTKFTVTLAASGLGASGMSGGLVATVTPSDFTASATDKQGGPAITNYAYRAGPFVIDQPHVPAANPIVTAWQTANPTVKVHVATAAFTGFVKRELIAAPSIAVFDDGSTNIAFNYMNAAKIPNSAGLAWANGGVDLLSPAQIAGASCPSDNSLDCIGTSHSDGALFDGAGLPKYCQYMSMQWNDGCSAPGCTASGNNTQSPLGREVVREFRSFLRFPTHLFLEGLSVTSVENNTNAARTIAASPIGATESGTAATFTTTTPHNFSVGDAIGVSGVGVAGYNGHWSVATIISATQFTATLPAGLAASGGGTVWSYNGLFLTTAGYSVAADPKTVDSYNFDLPFAQYDGSFKTAAGSQPAYSLLPGSTYKTQDVVLLTAHANPVGVVGVSDVWMTGFLDGQCLTTQEFCDPSFAQGKVSYLGGNNYGTNAGDVTNSQGTRLFLNALFEAPCATDLGAASISLIKTAPAATLSPNTATYTITALNNGASTAGNVVITDVLGAGVAFVSAVPGAPTCTETGGTVTCSLGALGTGQTTVVTITVSFTGADKFYNNTATATYKAGVTTLTATSNTTSTCSYHAGNAVVCASGGDPNAPACANGTDNDGDGLIDFPDDPGCNSAIDNEETDAPAGGVIKGRVLIVFDTSGSMMWNTCRNDFTGGDGSLSCPGSDVACLPSPPGCNTSGCGNGIADDSRLWKVKTGITNVVSGFGEVEWGLMRFKQLPVDFSCGTLNVNKNDGGWQGAGGAPCTGFNAGELTVKFDPQSANSLLGWMDHATNYLGTPPIGKDFELRATGNTPLAGALATARTYIAATRSADNALVAACRPYRVILVTDGAETCAGDPAAQSGLLFTAGDSDGVVPVHVIGFSTPDPQTQTQLDQIASQGGTTRFVPADDDAQLSAAIVSIVQSTILVELCNDLDDDCDGKIDEGFPEKGAVCNNGAKGVCLRSGARVCDANGSGTHCDAPAVACSDLGSCTEICNGLDDDCDGKIDEAPAMNCTCVPTSEACNCNDDDCDGKVDEGSLCPSGGTCTSCQCALPCAGGEFPCLVGQKCSAGNFCVIDPCFGKSCPNVNGNKQTCIEDPSADPFDHLCVDACSVMPCSAPLICYAPTGECRPDDCSTFPDRCAADQSCVNGTCVGNPCAGVTCPNGQYCLGGACLGSCADVTCPAGQRCRHGACETDPCGAPCPFGEACNDATGTCIEDPCTFRNCPQGQWCNPNDGQCEDDPCVTNHVVCPDPAEVCRGGTCDRPSGGTNADAGAHVTVGGGGGCRTTSGSELGLALGLALLLVTRRRRGDA